MGIFSKLFGKNEEKLNPVREAVEGKRVVLIDDSIVRGTTCRRTIAMLRRAGLGVAMGNAPDFVKEAADVVTDRYDEDGAARAIEGWALK